MPRTRSLALFTGLLAAVLSPGCGSDTKVTTVSAERNADGDLVIVEKDGGSADKIVERAEQDEYAQSVARTQLR